MQENKHSSMSLVKDKKLPSQLTVYDEKLPPILQTSVITNSTKEIQSPVQKKEIKPNLSKSNMREPKKKKKEFVPPPPP